MDFCLSWLVAGKPVTAMLTGKHVQLDWRQVFRVTRDVIFAVHAGTEPGFGDVISHVTTASTRYEGESAVVLTSRLYVIIEAVYDNGATRLYQDTLAI
jgi:hypothetical protein